MTLAMTARSRVYNGTSVFSPNNNASGREGKHLDKRMGETAIDLQAVRTYRHITLNKDILNILSGSSGYASINKISETLDIPVAKIENALSTSKRIHKSFIRGKAGEDVYTTNGPLKDAWRSFCHINSRKL